MKLSKIYKLYKIFIAMPYVSEKQRAFFNANKAKLEDQGVNVDEWNEASKGKKLPEHSNKKKKHEFAGDHLKNHKKQ